MEDTVTDERVGLFTPDKDRCTADGMGRAAVIVARRGTVCGEVGRVLRFPQLRVRPLYGWGGQRLAKAQVSIRATANFDQQISRGGRKF